MRTSKVGRGSYHVQQSVGLAGAGLHYLPVEVQMGRWQNTSYFGMFELGGNGSYWMDALVHFSNDTEIFGGYGCRATMVYENMVTPAGWDAFDLRSAADEIGYQSDASLWWIRLDVWAMAIAYENRNPVEAFYFSPDLSLPDYHSPTMPREKNPYMHKNCFKVYRNNPRKRYYRGERR